MSLKTDENETECPAYADVLRAFVDTILIERDRHYLEFDRLVEEWDRVRNSLGGTTASNSDIRSVLEFVATYSIDTKSPYFISKLYSGSDSLSLLADMLISYYNTNVHVYSVSPVFTMAEHLMVDRISHLIDSTGYGTGLFLPGGSYCNLVGLIAARYHYDRTTKNAGITGLDAPLKIIASSRSHYSIEKAAIMMGIGLDNVIKVDYDKATTEDLELIISNNRVFAICTTFGTTSEGVLETIERFRPLLNRYRVWHHVDACVGGVMVYSDDHRKITSELKHAHSIGMDFHKIMNIAVQCSGLMVRSDLSYVLSEVTSVDARYLFHANDNNHDIAAMSFQCGRKADAFRLFIYDSLIDLSNRVDDFLNRVEQFNRIIEMDDRYTPYSVESNMTHVLFTPTLLLDQNEEEIHDNIGQIVRALRTENIFLEYHDTYFRLVPINPKLTSVEFNHILNRIDHYFSSLQVVVAV